MIDQNKKNVGQERKQEEFKKDEKRIQPNVRQSERQADGVSRVKPHEGQSQQRDQREQRESRESTLRGQTNSKPESHPRQDRDLKR